MVFQICPCRCTTNTSMILEQPAKLVDLNLVPQLGLVPPLGPSTWSLYLVTQLSPST